MTPTHRERQIMQRLRGNGWVKATTLPDMPKTFERLLAKGWIESQGSRSDLAYRITEMGLTAKKAPIKILQSVKPAKEARSRAMSDAMERIVAAYVKTKNLRALESLRTHRQ